MTLLLVDRLRKSFGTILAVDELSFQLAPGEMLALIGPPGAGKTTVLDMIGGQLRPDGGRIRLGDDDITRAGSRAISRLGVGRSFQRTATFPSMTVRENVQTAILAARDAISRWWHPARRDHRSRADLLLQRVGLLDHAERGAGLLDPGELRRLDLALALAHRPRLLLLDEPTAGMAPGEGTTLMGLIRSLAENDGVAVLVTEPDADAVFAGADRVLVMDRGTLNLRPGHSEFDPE